MQSDCYCTNLRATMRSVSAVYDELLAPIGVNIAQFGLLRKMDPTGHEPRSIQQLADLVGLERSTVARNIRVLVREDFVAMGTSEADRRASTLLLTPKGMVSLREGGPLWEEGQRQVESMLNGRESAEDFRSVLRTLQRA